MFPPCRIPRGPRREWISKSQEQLLNAVKSRLSIATCGGSFVFFRLDAILGRDDAQKAVNGEGSEFQRHGWSFRSGKGFKFLNLDDHVNEHLFFFCSKGLSSSAKEEKKDDNAGEEEEKSKIIWRLRR